MWRKFLFDVKSVRGCLLLMILVADVFLPIINYFQMRQFPLSETFGDVMAQAQFILPIACAIPIAMYLRNFFECNSAEVLHTLPFMRQFNSFSILFLELLCMLLCIPVFIWYWRQYRMFLWQELLRTVAQALFLQNLAYAAVYFSRFHLAGLAAQILAVGLLQLPLLEDSVPDSILQKVNIYDKITPLLPRPWAPLRIVFVLLFGAALWRAGAKREKFYLEGIS